MFNIIVVSIVFGSLIALATLICGTVLIIIKTRRNQGGRRGANDNEEAEVIQEIYQGLEKMEERIEALETILTEGQKKEGK